MKKAKLIVGENRNVKSKIALKIASEHSLDDVIFIKSQDVNWALESPFGCTEKTKVIVIDWYGRADSLVQLFNSVSMVGIGGIYYQFVIIMPDGVTAGDCLLGYSYSRRFDIINTDQ